MSWSVTTLKNGRAIRELLIWPKMLLIFLQLIFVFNKTFPSSFLIVFIGLETKNQWARDDPAFAVIQAFFVGVRSFCFVATKK